MAVEETLKHEDSEEVAALVSDLPSTSVETRKACLHSLKTAVADGPGLVELR